MHQRFRCPQKSPSGTQRRGESSKDASIAEPYGALDLTTGFWALTYLRRNDQECLVALGDYYHSF